MKKLSITLMSTVMVTTILTAKEQNIVDTAVANPQFSTLVKALQAADLVDTVKDGTFTVFAPTNEAFDKIPSKTLASLLKPENKDQLTAILTYHVVPGKVSLSKLLELQEAKTVQGQTLTARFENGRVRVGEATLQSSDIACENGTIHVIDTVLMPPKKAPATIVEVAAAAGQFNTLLAAAKAAGLADALSGEGPFTVFAPTDAAFAKVPKHTLNNLLKPENKDQLVNLLKYHVISGEVRAGDALSAGEATALNGAKIPISYKDGGLRAQWAKVLEVDVAGGNGIIHIIDSVMLPPGKKPVSGIAAGAKAIELAVDKGVPMFNRGDEAGCAALYMQVSKSLMNDCSLPTRAKASLKHAVSKASHSSCATTQAWTLRRGIDHAYAAMRSAMNDQLADN